MTIVYHGSSKKFESFSLSKVGTGEALNKFGYGLYFTSSLHVADKYRQLQSDGSKDAFTTFHFSIDDYDESVDQNDSGFEAISLIYDEGFEDALSAYSDDDVMVRAISKYEGADNIRQIGGIIYEVRIPDQQELLNLDDGIINSNIDLMKVVIGLCGEANYNYWLDLASDHLSYDYSQRDIEDLFEKIFIFGNTSVLMEQLDSMCPDFDKKTFNEKMSKYYIQATDTYLGSHLYSHASYILGGEKKASEFFRSIGVRGSCTVSNLIRGFDDKGSTVYVIWDEQAISIKSSSSILENFNYDEEKNNVLDYDF
jgi:hypothetical protein